MKLENRKRTKDEIFLCSKRLAKLTGIKEKLNEELIGYIPKELLGAYIDLDLALQKIIDAEAKYLVEEETVSDIIEKL